MRSRRGWNMTELLPELEALPKGLVLDGELVAFNDDGDPHFPLLCRRMLHGDRSVPVRLMIFDVLAIEGEPLLTRTHSERRKRLEELALEGLRARCLTPSTTAPSCTKPFATEGSKEWSRSRAGRSTDHASGGGSR